MSERMKEKLGEELYNQVITKVKPEEFDLLDGWVPRKTLNEANSKAKAIEEKVSLYEKQINETKNMLKDSEELKGQYSKLQEQYTLDLQAKDKEISNVIKKSMFKENLTKLGAKHPDLLMKEVNFNNLTLDNNNLVGATDVINNIKTTYPDLFIQKTADGNDPKDTGNSNNNGSGKEFDFSKF